MGRPAKATTVVLVPGVNLKCDPRTRIWYFNSSLNRQTIRKSTGEKDETAARIKGMEWYFLLKEGQGRAGILNCISFDMLAESYLKTVIGDAKWRYHSETIDRHLLPYFETHGDIKQITEGTISDYLVHRRTKGKQEPVPQTLSGVRPCAGCFGGPPQHLDHHGLPACQCNGPASCGGAGLMPLGSRCDFGHDWLGNVDKNAARRISTFGGSIRYLVQRRVVELE